MLDISQASKDIHSEVKEKGFWKERLEVPKKMKESGLFTDKEIDFVEHNIRSQMMLLIVCEISEAEEALRKDCFANLLAFGEEYAKTGNLVESFEKYIKDTYEDEIADAIIRIFDLAEGDSINIEQHIILKRLYNQQRPYKHGKNA